MKKPTSRYLERIRRLVAYRKHRDTKKRLFLSRERAKRRKNGGSIKIIQAPIYFCLSAQHIKPLFNFIEQLKRVTQIAEIAHIRIDFSRTEKMISNGTLYFLAVLDSLKMRYPKKRFSMVRPSDPIVEQVLQQIGVNNLLNASNRLNPKDFHKTVRHWCVASGTNVDASNADNVFTQCSGILTPELCKSVYTGVTEAMTNCVHHAYDDFDIPREEQKWWLFSREYNNELQVIFCDLGMGIPRSLYRQTDKVDNSWWDNLKTFLQQYKLNGRSINDGLKIKAAIEIGQTRTRKENRGLGLKQMVSNLDDLSSNQSKVEIISGSGIYRRQSAKQANPEYVSFLSEQKNIMIQGTLIYWCIPLSSQQDL